MPPLIPQPFTTSLYIFYTLWLLSFIWINWIIDIYVIQYFPEKKVCCSMVQFLKSLAPDLTIQAEAYVDNYPKVQQTKGIKTN